MNKGTFKEVYDVVLKITSNMEINGKLYEENEPIAIFDSLQIAGLDEITNIVSANGGYGNRPHVFWITTKEIDLIFQKGVFSLLHFGLFNNAKIIDVKKHNPITISKIENLETDQYGVVKLQETPCCNLFCYNKNTGEKLSCIQANKIVTTEKPFTDITIIYDYQYDNGATVAVIGKRFLNNHLSFEAKTRLKDDTTGMVTTGLIKIPKLILLSDLKMQIGEQAHPITGIFSGKGLPVGPRNNSYVAEFYFLNDDISGDM